MKKLLFNPLQSVMTVLLSTVLLFSCSQLETFEASDLQADAEVMAKNGFNLSPFGISGNDNARTYDANDCNNLDFCIDPADPDPEYSMLTAAISHGDRTFTYTVHNTLTGFNLAWIYSAGNQGARKLRITVSGAGFSAPIPYTSNTVQGSGNDTHTFNFNALWAACGVVTILAEILEDDVVKSTQTTTYKLIGACPGCEDEFSAVLNCSNPDAKTLTVTFTAENAGDYVIQGGLTSGALIGSAVATADFIRNTSHPSAGGPSNVTRWEGSLDDCETVTVTIIYSGGNGVGSWSAKSKVDGVEVVNGESEDQDCD